MQNADGGLRREFAFKFGLVKSPTYNSQSQLILKNAVDGCIRHFMHPLECFIRVVTYSRGVAQQQDKKDKGIGRHLADVPKHLVEGIVIEPCKCDVVGVRRKFMAKRLRPVPLKRRRPDYDRNVRSRRRKLQNRL